MSEHPIREADTGIRLDRWFKRHQPDVPHAMLQKWLRKGAVRLDGRKASADTRLQTGQSLSLPDDLPAADKEGAPRRYRPSEAEISALQHSVLYKDKDVLIINKPSGLAVQGGSKQYKHIDAMLDHLRFSADERPRLVHRLDRDTSGCLVLARSANAAAKLASAFAAKDAVKKTYLALVNGFPLPTEGEIALPLAKLEQGKDSREAVQVTQAGGKPALTRYRVVEHLANRLAWVALEPVTGRTHQLRVHMAAIGHPIIGDGKYGGAEAFVHGIDLAQRLHLHAQSIVLQGAGGKEIRATAPLPPHMVESRKLLGMD